MTWLRNAAALPLICVALVLWFAADQLAKLSKAAGDGAARLMGPER